MRKYFIGSYTVSAKPSILTQELEKFPALEENCNIDINDDSIGTHWVLSIYIKTQINLTSVFLQHSC